MYAVLSGEPHLTVEAEPFSVRELADYAGVIQAEPIPVLSDEEILETAEQTGRWDELGIFEYGTDPAHISLSALRKRFGSEFFKGKPSEELIAEPGYFVEAIWASKRQIPTVGEYAQQLGKQGLLNPDEVKYAQIVSRLDAATNQPDYDATEQAVLKGLTEDDSWHIDNVRSKLTYFINLHPGSPAAEADSAKAAADYAMKVRAGRSDLKTAHQAWQMLLRARGVDNAEMAILLGKQMPDSYHNYRAGGIDAELARHMAEHPQASIFRPFSDVDGLLSTTLSGNLHTQLAVRQFLGIGNLYEFLNYQARADRLVADSVSAAKAKMATYTAALDRGDTHLAEQMEQELRQINTEEAGPETVFELDIYTPEEQRRFASLAAFIIHEPSLRGIVAHFTRGAMMKIYLDWLDTKQSENNSTIS